MTFFFNKKIIFMQHLSIKSPARIHLGFLELDPFSSRNFGSLGLAISGFDTKVSLKKSKKTIISGEKKEIAELYLRKMGNFWKKKPFKIDVLKNTPSHIGLGSGTQLALSLGYLINKYFQRDTNIEKIALKMNRGNRSGIGIGCFKNGGFLIDGGKEKNSKTVPPIIFNSTFPNEWRLLLIFDNELIGIHGKQEIDEFQKIKKVKKNFSNENCRSLVLNVMPGILEKNFKLFCIGIQKIQENTAKIFDKSQGGMYTSKKIQKIFKYFEKIGINGFGQSSWGPTGFVLCENSFFQKEIFNLTNKFLDCNNIKNITIIKTKATNNGFIEKEYK